MQNISFLSSLKSELRFPFSTDSLFYTYFCHIVYWFLIATVTIYDKLSGLIQHKVFILTVPEVTNLRWVSLYWEDPSEQSMTTHLNILAWKILWTEDPGGLPPWGWKGLDTDWSDWSLQDTCNKDAVKDMRPLKAIRGGSISLSFLAFRGLLQSWLLALHSTFKASSLDSSNCSLIPTHLLSPENFLFWLWHYHFPL